MASLSQFCYSDFSSLSNGYGGEEVGTGLSALPCGLSRAIAILKDQYALGTLEIKVVQPRDFFLKNQK